MSQRLVICLRWRPPDEGTAELVPQNAVEGVLGRVAALGGRVILWHPEWVGVDFDIDALQDAIDFLVDRPPDGFGAGFAHGEVRVLADGGSHLAAASGEALDTAVSLARMARVGEVLVDPGLALASAGEVLTKGGRTASFRGEKIRGLPLDLVHPQRSLEPECVSKLTQVPWVGPPVALEYQAGEISVISGGEGSGRSRYLVELGTHFAPGALWVRPGPMGQPLGALGQALRNDALRSGGVPSLGGKEREVHEALMDGQAVAHEPLAGLVAHWVSTQQEPRVVLIDDCAEVDADSLEVLALSCRGGVALVVTQLASTDLPPSLGALPLCQRIALAALSEADAMMLLRQMCPAPLSDELAVNLVRRSELSPLDIVESLVEALDARSLLFSEAGLEARIGQDTREPHDARKWLARRLLLVEPAERLVLDALAVLGGRSEPSEIERVLTLAGRPPKALEATLGNLSRQRWLQRGPGDAVSLLGRTSRLVVSSGLSERCYRALCQACAGARAGSGGALALASAALYAHLVGNDGKAQLLARRAASSARAGGLESSAVALETFGEKGEFAALEPRNLAGLRLRQPGGAAPEAHDDHLFTGRVEQVASVSPVSDSIEAEPAIQRNLSLATPPENGAGPAGVDDALDEAAAYAPLLSESDSFLPARAQAALQQGDKSTLHALAAELKGEHRPLLAERLEAMACLVEGSTGEAIRRLRDARSGTEEGDLSARCRAQLALSVGLAIAGRMDEALLEALDGLACGREAEDARGERACMRLIAQLATGAEEPEVAQAWVDATH